MARLPSRLREDIMRRARTHYANDPQKEGFCPRCTNKIADGRHNFCGICGAGLVSATKVEAGLLNSDEPNKPEEKARSCPVIEGFESPFMKGMLPKF